MTAGFHSDRSWNKRVQLKNISPSAALRVSEYRTAAALEPSAVTCLFDYPIHGIEKQCLSSYAGSIIGLWDEFGGCAGDSRTGGGELSSEGFGVSRVGQLDQLAAQGRRWTVQAQRKRIEDFMKVHLRYEEHRCVAVDFLRTQRRWSGAERSHRSVTASRYGKTRRWLWRAVSVE